MEAKGDIVKLICGNGQLSIESSFKADIKEEGICLVPGRVFSEIIKRCYDGEVEVLTENEMTINSGKAKMSIGILDSNDYPKMDLQNKKFSFTIENSVLKDMVKGSIFCVAGENTPKQVLTGVYVESDGEKINFVSIDGCRMAIKKQQGSFDTGKFVIPAKTLEEIIRTVGDVGACEFTVYENYIKVVWENISIISVLFKDEEYVNFKDILPKEYKIRIKVKVFDILSSIERGSILSRLKQNNLLVLNIDDNCLGISAKSDVGELYDEIEVYQEGEAIKIGFNGGFLSDCFKAITDEFVYIEFNSERSPCIIRPISGDNFLYMILPIQIN